MTISVPGKGGGWGICDFPPFTFGNTGIEYLVLARKGGAQMKEEKPDYNEEARVLVREKPQKITNSNDMNTEINQPKPDDKSPGWEEIGRMSCGDYEYANLRRKLPINPMPEIKPGGSSEREILLRIEELLTSILNILTNCAGSDGFYTYNSAD